MQMAQRENVIVLDPADQRAQQIGRAISSPLAGEILQLFSAGPMTLSKISDLLSVPINTAKYHVENLMEAGLLEIVDTKYSEKGREMKLYALRNQVVIVAPSRTDVKEMLMRYASVFGIVAMITLVLAILQPVLLMPGAPPVALEKGAEEMMVSSAVRTAGVPLYTMELLTAFFIGSCIAIAILAVVEWKKSGS